GDPDQTVAEDSGAHTVPGFATLIDDGDPEATQTLTFNVSTSNDDLFAVLPEIDETTGNLTYTLAANANGSATVTVTLSDDGGDDDTSAEQTFTITVTAVNDAPVTVGAGTVNLTPVPEDSATPTGATVGSLFAARFSDAADQVSGGSAANLFHGIAIIGSTVNAAQGQWQYFNGSDWVAVGSRTLSTALAVTFADSLRFLPAENFNGTPNSLTVVLIDDSAVADPATGDVVDLTGATGGTTAYSDDATQGLTLSTSVTAVNDAPVVNGSNAVSLAAVAEDTTDPAGATVNDLFLSRYSDAADQVTGGSSANTFHGIAIIGSTVNTAEGQWQYHNGSGWVDVDNRGLSTALVVTAGNSLRFLPAADFSGTPNSLTVVLIDDSAVSDPTTGTEINLTGVTGSTTAYSDAATETLTLSTTITEINDAPIRVSPGGSTIEIDEDTTTNLNLDFGPGGGSDENGQALTIVFTALPDAALGQLQLADNTPVALSTNYTLEQVQGIKFAPAADTFGTATFSYTVTDNGTTNGVDDFKSLNETLTIQVNNDNVVGESFGVVLPPVAAGTFTLRVNGGILEVFDGTSVIASQTLATTPNVVIHGSANTDDTLILDLDSGFTGSITFHGGAGGNDAIQLENGGTFTTVQHVLDATFGAGSITLTGGNQDYSGFAINYTGLEPVMDNLLTTTRVIEFASGAEIITISDHGTAGDGFIEIVSSAPSEMIIMEAPTVSLTVIANDAGDTIEVTSFDSAFGAALILDGGGGIVDIQVALGGVTPLAGLTVSNAATVTVGAVTTSGAISLTSTSSTTLQGNLQTDGGTVSFLGAGNVILDAAAISIDTDVGDNNGSGAAVSFAGTTAVSATANGTTLSIDTRAAAGAGGAVTLDAFNSAGGAAVDGLTVQAGNAAVSFNDAASFTASSPITVTGASFTVAAAGSIATSGGTVTINANAMDIQGAINAGAGTVNLRPQTDGTTIGLGGGTGTLQLTDAELDQITAGVLVIGSHTDASDPVDAGAISVDLVDLTDGLGVSTLVLRTTGTITQKVVDAAADILVDNLSLQAGGNIIIQIDADNLAATTTTGQITITDTAGGLTIDDLSGSGGADGVSHTGSGNVTVSVTGANSNLTVGALVTGGNVTLNAAGDVALAGDVTAEGGGNVRITADSDNDTNGAITRTSGTVSAEDGGGVEADAADGINLVTAASSLSARNDSSGHISISNDSASLAVTLVDSIDGISNTGAGNISISNTGTLAVASKVSTAGGKIELTGTTITVNETIVSDSGTDGDITLTADEFVINTGINAGTAIVTLQNQTANTAIQLGNGKGATAGIDLADAELNQITAGTLRIGSTTAGQISISEANVGPNNVTGDFTLLSGAGVDDNSDTGTIVFNGGLLIDVDQSVDLSGSNNVNTLSVITSDANQFVTFVDSDGLAIGGITTKGGNVGITATTINLNAGINTSTGSGGAVSLTGPVILTNTVVITTDDGNVTFSGTVNGNFDLTVNTANATTTFTGAVGGDVALASLTTDAGGTTELNGGSVSTTGAQTYNDAVTLGADTDINTTTTGGVAFQDTLDGAFALTVVAVADATFGDEVGGGTPLASLDVTANQINLDGGLVETSGDQTYQSAVVLGAATTVASSAGGNITFGGAVDSEASEANTLTVNTTGTTTFSGAVGGGVNGALGSLTTNAGGTTAINGGAVDTTGAQTYGDAVTLGVQDATLTASTLSMTVLNLGSSGLTVDVSGASSITGKISGGSVNSLTKNGAGTLTLSNGSNNYTGLTTINNGVLKVTTNKALGADGAGNGTRVNSGAMLDLAVLNYSALEELFMNGGELHASNTSTFAGDITLEALDSFFSAVAGKTLTLNGAIVEEDDETNGLTVTRPGTVVLKGNGSYSGETEVTNGKLLINGAIDGSVLVSGGTLGGNGTIGGNVTADSGGTVAPGTSAGLLSVGGNGNFTSGATYSVELNGPGAGTGYDQLLVNGTANLNGAILALSATQVYSSGTVLTIIDGANSGTFAGLDDGDTITATGTSQVFTINYEAGSVTLTAGSLDLIDTVATVSGPSLVVVGQQAVFTVTVTGGPTPTGLVTLYVDGHIVASGPLNSGQASFATSSLSIGTHTVSAYYNGDSTHDPDTSNNFTVNVVTPSVVDNFTRADTIGTTIAGASIGQLLPSGSGVLNVADTTGFASSGQLIIHFGGGAFTTVNYTGKTGTSFTGVTGGQTLAGVPLDAGDTVRPLTSLGSGWSNVTPPVGNFVVNSNQAVSVGSTSNLALVNGLAPADVSLSAAIDVSADNRRGELVARRDAAGNEYVGGVQRINATTHRLYIGIRTGSAGTLATLNSVVVSTPPSVLRFEVVGTTLRLYGDGVLLLSAQDATLAAAGGIGINAINTNVRFDNFIAAAVVPISLPFNDNFAQPSSTSLGASWSVDAGGFSNPSAGAATAGSATLNVASLYGVLASDVSAQANFSSSSMGSGLGVVVRWDSVARSGYYLQATDAGDIELYSVTAGVVSLITSGSGTILENNQLMLTANGSTLDVFLNGALLFSATNSLYTTGSVGIASAGGSLFSGFSAITP
ncbi:MAG: Ig-like domain repeat protein, partial [Planctomycetia bacterium]|nr:Ig-like domain repeat protein [Planctomycetia bacterium]